MKTKSVITLIHVLVLCSLLSIVLSSGKVYASATIYIRYDGSVDPPTAPIQRIGNLYLFTADIYDSIVIQRDYVVVDGNGYKLHGTGSGYGFYTENMHDVTIIGANVTGFNTGVYSFLSGPIYVKISSLSNNQNGIVMMDSSGTFTGNTLSYNSGSAILFYDVGGSLVNDNSIEYNHIGIQAIPMIGTSSNYIVENTIAYNDIGLSAENSGGTFFGNLIYHNNFVDNAQQTNITPMLPGTYPANNWTNGYPSGGNFWSNYTGIDLYNGPNQDIPGSDGIGDTPHTLVPNNVDNYPLMTPYGTTQYLALRITATTGGTTNPPVGTHIYIQNTAVIVEATAESSYFIDHWELDGANAGQTNPISITMDNNHVLHAVFRAKPDIAVISVSSYPTNVRRGQPVYIAVGIQNQGSLTETFDVIVYADKDRNVIGDEIIIAVRTVYNLPASGTRTENFTWDTTSQATGTYYISAKAAALNDIDPADNQLTAKRKVTIKR
jgi:hypothetical protein